MTELKKKENEINTIIRKNLNQIMNAHGLTVSNFCKYIDEKNELSLDRSTFTKFMNNSSNRINIAFLVSCSQVFKLPLDSLVNPDFNPQENYQEFEKMIEDIPKIKRLTNSFSFDYSSNGIFIENIESPLLKKYIQQYYCYYYSTVATENNTDKIQEALISGLLNIEPTGEKCKATLKIDTKKIDENGNPVYKTYTGDVIACPSIQSVYCMLTLPLGDFCFIIFRYSHLNNNKQECRLAEVLSTSSMPDKRYPIVHRMFLSNEKIKEEDLITVAPHLCLNSSDILISETELLALADEAEDYDLIVQEIFKTDPELMYCIKEKIVKDYAEKYLDCEELSEFITKLRSHSFAKRYNKVNTSADELIRNALVQKGYFQKDFAK